MTYWDEPTPEESAETWARAARYSYDENVRLRAIVEHSVCATCKKRENALCSSAYHFAALSRTGSQQENQ